MSVQNLPPGSVNNQLPLPSEQAERRQSLSTPLPYQSGTANSPRSYKRKNYGNAQDAGRKVPPGYGAPPSATRNYSGEAYQTSLRPDSRVSFANRVHSFVDDKETQSQYAPAEPLLRYESVKGLLIEKVLQKRFFPTPEFFEKTFGFPDDAFNISTLASLFQIFNQVAIIVIASQLLKNDETEILRSVWAFLIAQSLIILAVSTFFTLRVLRIGRSGTIFYSVVCAGLTIAAFAVCLAKLMPSQCTNTMVYCRLRRAITGLVSLSTFLWLIEIVVFLTIVYVARLDIIPDPLELTQPFSHQYAGGENLNTDPSQFLPPPPPMEKGFDGDIQGPQEQAVKKYIVTETGLTEVQDEEWLKGKNIVELYVDQSPSPPL